MSEYWNNSKTIDQVFVTIAMRILYKGSNEKAKSVT